MTNLARNWVPHSVRPFLANRVGIARSAIFLGMWLALEENM
jgi:hypothetical protein